MESKQQGLLYEGLITTGLLFSEPQGLLYESLRVSGSIKAAPGRGRLCTCVSPRRAALPRSCRVLCVSLTVCLCGRDVFPKQRISEGRGARISSPVLVMEAAGKGDKAAGEGETKERSPGHNPEECPVCMTVFDDTVQRPRALPCGHTVCTLCVNQLKQQDHVACPECRISHAVLAGGQFPVCYTIEAFIRRKDGKVAAAASPSPSAGTWKGVAAAAGQKESVGLSRIMRSFLQEQEASVVAVITACQEVQAQLDQYQTTLSGWGEQQQQLEDRLQGLLDQSRNARELVRQEESRAAAKKEEAREGERQLHSALEALSTPVTDKEARVAAVEVFRCTEEAVQVIEECRAGFPDANTAITVRKVREASTAVLKAFQATLVAFQADLEAHSSVAEEETRAQPEADCTIPTPSLKAEHLRSPTQPVRELLEDGRVFGVHQLYGQHRHARISLEDARMYLHTLKVGFLPPGALAIQVSQLVPPSPPCVVFLDLSWPGRMPQRVLVRLSPDTPRGRQMALLCTGQRGPSYAGSCLFMVGFKLRAGESVCGGDYESNDGKGGAALLPDLDEGEYRKSGKAGAVWGWRVDPAKGAQFGIRTRDCGAGVLCGGVFGEVVQGLEAVMAAALHPNTEEVTIKDCGVVLWG